jgi:hypothetical protein
MGWEWERRVIILWLESAHSVGKPLTRKRAGNYVKFVKIEVLPTRSLSTLYVKITSAINTSCFFLSTTLFSKQGQQANNESLHENQNPTMTKHSTNQEVFQLLTIQHET